MNRQKPYRWMTKHQTGKNRKRRNKPYRKRRRKSYHKMNRKEREIADRHREYLRSRGHTFAPHCQMPSPMQSPLDGDSLGPERESHRRFKDRPTGDLAKRYRTGKNRKRRNKPNRKRRHKPYHKMSLEEREKADERRKRRAARHREYLRSRGHTFAPHYQMSPPLQFPLDGDSLGPEREFHRRFKDMSISDLAERYLTLEREVEKLEKRTVDAKIKVLQEEVERYKREIDALTRCGKIKDLDE